MKTCLKWYNQIGMHSYLMHYIGGLMLCCFVLINLFFNLILLFSPHTVNFVLKHADEKIWLFIKILFFFPALFHCVNGIKIIFLNVLFWLHDYRILNYTVFIFVSIVFLYHVIPIIEQIGQFNFLKLFHL